MMSSQTVQESGDSTKEKVPQEVEKVTRLQNPQIPIQPRTKVNISQRPIAPAPGPVHSALSGAGSVTAPKAHIIPKVPQGLMGNTIEQQTLAGNTGAAQAPLISKSDSALPNTQTTSIPTVPIPTPVNIQAQSLSSSVAALGQPQIPMASLIKSTTPQQPATGGAITQVSVTQASVPYYQSHIPKGPALAANIAPPKGGTVATAVIPRLAQAGVLQQQTLSGIKHTVPQPNVQQVIMPSNKMRSGTPPSGAPRSTSPHVTVAAAPSSAILGNEAQRTLASAGPPGTIQIMPAGVRATLGQSQKPVQIPQPVLQPQKVVMTQSAVSQIVTTGAQGPTLDVKNTAATSALPRTQKIVISQQTTQSLASAQPTSKVTQALNLSQQTLQKTGPHTQILVSQPQGGVQAPGNTPTVQTPVMNISQAINPHNKPHQILVSQPSTAKTGFTVNQPMQRPQQIVMTSATLQGHTSIVSTKPTSAALNLSQAKPKQMLMAQIPGHSVGPKTGTPVSTAISSAVSMASATALSNTIASTLTSPPVAKVAPQRQLPSPQQNPELQRESFGMQALQQGNVLFHQPGHRGSPQPAMTASLPASHAEARPIERSNLSQGFNIPAPQQELLFYNLPIAPGGQMQPFQTGSFRPSFANQTPNLASTLQAAAQGGTRPNLINIVDPRHPMTQFGQTHISEAVHGGSGDPGAAGIFSTNVSQPVGVTPSPAVTNASASPRPSILRKRSHAHEGITVVKRNLMAGSETSNSPMQDSHPPAAISPKSNIPCDPSRENSQSSTDTATSNESTPQGNKTPELKIKQEPMEGLENGPPIHAGLTPSVLANNVESSPRKKPRKQLLNATEELKDGNSSTDEDIERFPSNFDIKKDPEEPEVKKEFVDEEGVRWVAEKKRPNISLLNHYQCAWKAKNNHFQRYSDVKPKEERRPTVNELANQKGLMQKSSGWKLYHLAAQLEEMMDMEKDVFSKISSVQESIAPKHIAKHTIEDDIGMVHELTQGNIQRCQLFIDQLEEAKTSMLKITDHKLRINEIILKHHSKRPVKKKERT